MAIILGRPSSLIQESDLTYLGSFRMPASVTYGSDVVTTAWSRCPIAYRGKGGVDRILMTSDHVEDVSPFHVDRVYEVTVPALLASPPYNIATVAYAWGDVYDGKAQGSGDLRWTNGLFVDHNDWDILLWNTFQFYGPDSSLTSFGKSSLNDGTGEATGIASWRLDNADPLQTGGGCLKIPDAFVTANCPGKPYMVGFGGAWMSTVQQASVGPAFRATVNPDIGTYAHDTSLPNVVLMRHAKADSPPVGELRARRAADYKGALYGVAQAGTTTNRLFLDANAYPDELGQTRYDGKTVRPYTGAGTGQERVMTYISGREYSISPNWDAQPGDEYETTDYFGDNNVIPPDGDVGYWNYGDFNPQSTIWVDGTKRGVCVLVTYCINRQFYAYSGPGPIYQNFVHRMRVYDPDDLAAIVAGEIEPWEAEPVSEWDFDLPGKTYPLEHDFGGIANMTLDVANRKAYISDYFGWHDGSEWHPVVHVYQIGGSN